MNMKIARTYFLTFLVILLMLVSGCFDHTAPAPTGSAGTALPSQGQGAGSASTMPSATLPGTGATDAPGTAVTESGTAPTAPTEATAPPTEPPETTAPPTAPPTTEPPTEPPETTAPSTEPEPTLPDLEDEDFVRITDFVPNARQELRYATENNFTGQVIYGFSDAWVRFGTVKKLIRVAEALEELGLGLVIWDAYRPLYAQQRLWDACPDANFVSQPGTGRQNHCRGLAVDLTLYDLATGEMLEMPSGFDEFSALGDRDYSDCSETARENGLILENAMKNGGFQPYSGEWWHFNDSEDYPLEEIFDPEEPRIWTANCNEYIHLRNAPGGKTVGHIPKGATFQLLQWQGKYARVLYDGTVGWVSAAYAMPAEGWLEGQLDTVAVTAVYTYETMLADLQTLAANYPELAELDLAGTSELGRRIPVLRIGDPEAAHQVLLQGAIHGREHATAWLLMAMAETWLKDGGFEDLCIHILPMTNPDGVAISQAGTVDDGIRWIYDKDRRLGRTDLGAGEYARLWKANGLGVDLNRNFPTGWESLNGPAEPSSQKYRGSEPFSAAEAKALRDYTLGYEFDITVSYHATGSLVYYGFGENDLGLDLAKAFRQVSGYAPTPTTGVDAGGYKDWAVMDLGIPSLTVEIGCGEAPLQQRELYSAYARNIRLGQVIRRYLEK